MGQEIVLIAELEVAPENLDEFKRVVAELVAVAREEPGTLRYEFSVSADGATIHAFERYRDSVALIAHLGNFKPAISARIRAVTKTRGVTIYGTPDAAARSAIERMNPRYMAGIEGFSR